MTDDSELKDQTLDDLDDDAPLQILWWGPPKSGKTVAAHTFPRTRTLDFDRGMQSVMWGIRSGYIDKDPEDVVYRTIQEERTEDLFEASWPDFALDRATDTFDEWMNESDQWDTLIVDSATMLSEYCINKALYQLDKHMDGFTESVQRSKSLGFRVMGRQDWQPAMSLFEDFINMVRGIDKHLIVIAHEYEETNEEGRVTGKYPLLIGQLRQRVPKDFDEVYFQNVEGTKKTPKYITQTQEDNKHIAGSRLGFLDYKEENLTYETIMRKRTG